MVTENQTAFKRRTLVFVSICLLAVSGAAVSLFHLARAGQVTAGTPSLPPLPKQLFVNWPKQDLMILLSADQRGYLLPCGCSEPQKGGLERRYNLMQMLKARGWPVVALDLGNIAQSQGPQSLPNVQGPIKYKYSMEALHKIGYQATSFGLQETLMPLDRARTEWPLNNAGKNPRVVVANIHEPFPDIEFPTQVATAPGTDIKVGIIGVVAPSVAREVKDPSVKFDDIATALPKALKELNKDKPHLRVLLFQGNLDEARVCAEKFPYFQIILCLDEADEPSEKPESVGKTLIVRIGHKGRFVGVMGVNWTPEKKLQFRYQLVELDPYYKTPAGLEKDNPVMALMEAYTDELRRDHYLDRYGKTKHNPIQVGKYAASVYVGSEKCKQCHEHAYAVWKDQKKSKHSVAYDTLTEVKHPSNRQFDGECVVCHVTGFQHLGGFTSLKGVIQTPALKHVGCESCHGPASMHVAAVGGVGGPNDEELYALMNPWKAKPNEDDAAKAARQLRINDFCMKCHDQDNDVHWNFKTKWAKIEHPTPQN
jgi:hypothetical protein